MAFYSAKNARVSVGNTNLFAMKWSINTKVDELDVSNFEGQGYAQWIGGLLDADISVDCVWDANQNPTGNPPNLIPGQLVSTVKFYADWRGLGPFGAGEAWTFPSLLITALNQETEVRSFIKYSWTAKNASATGWTFMT